MKKMLFVFNPTAGKGMIKTHLSEILDIFAKSDYDITVRPTQAPLDAYNYISIYGNNYDRVVVSGGDGTLNEAVKGMLTFDESNRRPIGYIPSGTTNDFASTLQIPKNMIEAAHIASKGMPFKCDSGKFNDKTFNYVAAFGAFTDIPYDTSQDIKNNLGQMAYVLEGIKRLSQLTSYKVKIKHDNGETTQNVFLCMVLNSTSVAGIHSAGKLIGANLSDGLFEMLLFRKPANLIDFNAVIMGLVSGKTSGENYSIIKSSHFEFESKEKIKWTLDGEYGGAPSHSVIDVLPSAITYIVDGEKLISRLLTQ